MQVGKLGLRKTQLAAGFDGFLALPFFGLGTLEGCRGQGAFHGLALGIQGHAIDAGRGLLATPEGGEITVDLGVPVFHGLISNWVRFV